MTDAVKIIFFMARKEIGFIAGAAMRQKDKED